MSRRSLRTRITAAATAVVAAAALLGSVLFVLVLSSVLASSAASAADAEAERVAALVEQGGPEAVRGSEGLVQLVVDGRVTAAGEDAEDLPPLALAESDDPVTVDVDDEGAVVVAARELDDDSLVVVGVPDEGREEAVSTTIGLLAVAVPLLIALVAVVCAVVVGRALRPVERMRAEAEAVTSSALDRRIAAPGSGDEVDRLAHTLNRMLDRLQSGQERQRRFVSDASHELRSPVAALRQTAEVALAHPDRLDSARLARTVAEESVRLGGLIEGLLLLARADEARLAVAAAPVDLDDLALGEVRRLRDSGARVDASGISPVQAVADEALLSRALRNLVDNAVRHRSSQLALSTRIDGAEAVLAVDDDGPGIPAAERERVLERFVRLDEGRARDAGGSGLGLAIVAGIARAHGGRVVVGDSALGGARVEVRVPLVR
ncbi:MULTISPECIES: cell wall metabolism sensor histidine kinase WalK [unclassified Rathayibacter]|uniref:sensor histidine kinase n=1 Tax=unclassified Rathayibacter TaxID=2609250 RepID=UPI000CE7C64B|nr:MULTISPECIES: ATP-binding protein [unclassified Rathayibacter]PPF49435.1 two-component sensor histidine kinase [Rathayibacter sp. AY1A1]PPG84301.1 two-component sensor histidine kinase [Rathayibacter sp. AY1H2]PPH01633.1 two-component sensor histidine kinase [Rathayibacter sp. AY1G9]PPH04933.1 two-component sensor histidine kinase [Rathayibacter sp. AY1F6]